MVAVVLGYVGVVMFFWNSQSRPMLEKVALPVWLVLLLYITAIAGPLREPLFCMLIVLVVIGFVTNLRSNQESSQVEECKLKFNKRIRYMFLCVFWVFINNSKPFFNVVYSICFNACIFQFLTKQRKPLMASFSK